MSRPLLHPHLPDTDVMTCLVSSKTPLSIVRKLQEVYSINVLQLFGGMTCDPAVAHHPDQYVMPYNTDTIFANKNICSINGEVPKTVREGLRNVRIEESCASDRSMNAVVLGDTWIGNPKTVRPEIYARALNDGKRIVSVKQGYTKCNICVVDASALITEDEGIARACTDAGIEVLLLRTNAVQLEPYPYGFIGGASGKIANDKLAFFGCIEKHPEYKMIEGFLTRHGVAAVSLYDGPLVDLGSLIPLAQE